jgi:RNA polymerase sigma-70 factor (ECF subfamily)
VVESDEELVGRIKRGETECFETLLRRYEANVYAVAYKICKKHREAEDIAQDIFLQVFRSLDQFDNQAKFSTWLYRLSLNKSLDYIRKQNKINEVAHEVAIQNAATSATPEKLILEREERQLAQEYIASLAPKYQHVIQLFYFEEKTYQEIAKLLDISIKTVESRLYRAKKRMQQMRRGEIE